MNPIVLAFIGDAVLEVMAREYVVMDLKIVKPNALHIWAIDYVSAASQAQFIDYALQENVFTEEELTFYRRGKNARDTRVLKNTGPSTHRKSTGFEAILGHLYLNKDETRLKQIFHIYETFVKQKREKNEAK